jgi:hypothetical protein
MPAISLRSGLWRFSGCQRSGAGFRRNGWAINGQLMAFLWLVRKRQERIFGVVQEGGAL